MANSVIGALRVMLGMDTTEFEDGADRVERRNNRLEKDFRKMGDKIGSAGRTMTLALTAPLLAFGGLSFKAASDAAELQDAFDRTFGGMSAAMNEWAVESGDAVGRSTQTMQENAFRFGAILKSAFSGQEAAGMSQQLSQLAVDLGSLYNLADSEARDKLLGALSGEAEGVRMFGIMMNETVVKAKALELGLVGVGEALTEQDKIAARYAIIMEQTADAQGNATETAGSTANQMKRVTETFQELQVTVGTKLLPVLTPLIEKLAGMLERFTRLPDGVQTFAIALGGIAAVTGPAMMGIGSLVGGLGTLIANGPKIVKALKAVQAAMLGLLANPILLGAAVVIGGIYLAWQNWDKIEPYIVAVRDAVVSFWTEHVKPIFDAVMEKVRAVADFFRDYFGAQIQLVVGGVSALLAGDFAGAWDAAKQFVGNAISAMLTVLDTLSGGAITKMAQLYNGVKNWLQDKLGAVFDWVREKVEMVEGAFAWLFDRVVGNSWIPDMVEIIGQVMATLEQRMVSPAEQAANATSEAFEGMGQRVQNSFASMAQNALGSLQGLVQGIKSGGILDIVGGVLGVLQGFGVFGAPSAAGGVPGFANGGSMALGGFPGVDTNVLSLNGNAIARVSRGEVMSVKPANDRGGATVVNNYYTLPSDEFWNRVDGRAAGVVGAAAPGIASAGANEAIGRIGRAQSRRFG